jgi:hypothetical protein
VIELRNAQGTRVWGRIDDHDDGYEFSYDDRPRTPKAARPATPVAAAPKRPRGRPRKHPLVVPPSPADAEAAP